MRKAFSAILPFKFFHIINISLVETEGWPDLSRNDHFNQIIILGALDERTSEEALLSDILTDKLCFFIRYCG